MSDRADANPGVLFSDAGHLRQDLDLVRQAVTRRWPIGDGDKKKAVKALRVQLKNPRGARHLRASIRLLKELEKMNQADEHAVLRAIRPPEKMVNLETDGPVVITLDPQMPGAHRLPRRALPSPQESVDVTGPVSS